MTTVAELITQLQGQDPEGIVSGNVSITASFFTKSASPSAPIAVVTEPAPASPPYVVPPAATTEFVPTATPASDLPKGVQP